MEYKQYERKIERKHIELWLITKKHAVHAVENP